MELYSTYISTPNIEEKFLEIERITMEKIDARKFTATAIMEMALIMLVLSVAHADDSPVPSHHPHSLPSVASSSPLPLYLLPLDPPPPRCLLALPTHSDFMSATMIGGMAKNTANIPKVNFGGMKKRVATLPIFPKLAGGSGKMFNATMMCGMICPTDEVTLDGLCSIACHPFKTLSGGGK